MTAGVHDGVTVRHLCCSKHECQDALPTQRHHFCAKHQYLDKICHIKDCTENARPGFRTCSIESHRLFQEAADEKNTAMFQLQTRLQNAAISEVPLAGSSASGPAAQSIPSDAIPTPSSHVKGNLTRSWTHNEQLFVRCCGIIISRATMFGSEGITGVKVSCFSVRD